MAPPLVLEDVSNLLYDTWPMIGDAVVNDGPGLMLIVEKFPWANTVRVTEGVEAALDEMRPGLQGIELDSTIFRPATFVEVALENLTSSLALGAGLVVVVLLLFLWDFRVAIISATIIPVTGVITLLVLSFTGTSLNVMVLAGLVIAIGAVVDDAIVDVENIVRRMRQARREGSDTPAETIVLDASLEVRSAIINASTDRNDRAAAGVLYGRTVGCVLPTACAGLCDCHIGLADGRPDCDTSADPDHATERTSSRARIAHHPLDASRL